LQKIYKNKFSNIIKDITNFINKFDYSDLELFNDNKQEYTNKYHITIEDNEFDDLTKKIFDKFKYKEDAIILISEINTNSNYFSINYDDEIIINIVFYKKTNYIELFISIYDDLQEYETFIETLN